MTAVLALIGTIAVPGCDDHRVAHDAPEPDAPTSIHDCTEFVDRSAAGADRSITFASGVAYAPKCLAIAVGQSVTWSGDFDLHPLEPGVAPGRDTDPPGAPNSPIVAHEAGEVPETATFTAPGDYPYYCSTHFLFGMIGVVRVRSVP